MAVSLLFCLIALGTIILLVVGTIWALVSLLSDEKGRTVLKVLLIIPAVVLVAGVLALFGYRVSAARHEAIAHQARARQQAEVERLQAGFHRMARVSGTVRYNGKPIPDGRITFRPSDGKGGRTYSADIPRGKYALPGIPVRTYRVEITATHPGETVPGPDGGEIDTVVQYLPAKYNRKSELRAEVVPGKNTFDFDLSDAADGVAMAAGDRPKAPESAEEGETPEEEPATAEQPAEDTVAEAEDRPDWVGREPRKVGGAYQVCVTVGPCLNRLECDRELPDELHKAVNEYAAAYAGRRARGHVRLPLDYLLSEVVKEEWPEEKQVVITPNGQIPEKSVPMIQLHVLLEFDHAVNARIQEEWDKVVVAERLYRMGALAVIVLAVLFGAYAYLKIDLATGGAYRGRLRLAAAGVIVLLVLVALLVVAMARRRPRTFSAGYAHSPPISRSLLATTP